jgi:two-component system, OmpR family, response regulator
VSVDPSKTRVLVVDDERNIVELISIALGYEGFEVRTAADGAQALAAVRDFAPDLVVLDVMLPDADGFELQARIRGDGQYVPVLFPRPHARRRSPRFAGVALPLRAG